MLLRSELPRDIRRLEDSELIKTLRSPEFVERFRSYFAESAGYTSSRLYQYGIVHCGKTKEFEWMDIGEAADAMGLDIPAAVVKLLLDNDLQVKIAGIMSESDVRKIVAHPLVMIGTDSSSGNPAKDMEDAKRYGSLHPRQYGTHPRVLGKYVRQERILTLEQAIMKMTSMPARRCNILDRGRISRATGQISSYLTPTRFAILQRLRIRQACLKVSATLSLTAKSQWRTEFSLVRKGERHY